MLCGVEANSSVLEADCGNPVHTRYMPNPTAALKGSESLQKCFRFPFALVSRSRSAIPRLINSHRCRSLRGSKPLGAYVTVHLCPRGLPLDLDGVTQQRWKPTLRFRHLLDPIASLAARSLPMISLQSPHFPISSNPSKELSVAASRIDVHPCLLFASAHFLSTSI